MGLDGHYSSTASSCGDDSLQSYINEIDLADNNRDENDLSTLFQLSIHSILLIMFSKSLITLLTLLNGTYALVKTYPVPANITKSTAFEVKVQQNTSSWQTLDLYQIGLHEINSTTGSAAVRLSSLAYFDLSGPTQVFIQYKNAVAKSVRVRPDSYQITPPLQNGSVILNLSKPQNLVVQFNDEVFDVLHLLVGGVEDDIPSPSDPNVVYYGPGVHGSASETIQVPTGKFVYLEGGAVLQSSIEFNTTTDSGIRGRGMLYKPANGLQVAYSNNTVIDGITLVNANLNTGQAKGVHVRNVKSFSGTQWGDGMDFYSSEDVLVEGVFFRNSDDCVAIYNSRNQWVGSSKNLTVKDSSLWADVAHPVNIGTHGNTTNPETMSAITLSNIDILDHREPQVDYQGCIALNPGDGNLVQNVLIEDIRVEDFRLGQLLNMRVMYNTKYNTSPGRGIQDVLIRNLTYTGTHSEMSHFVGYNETRTISNVTIEGLVINGKGIYDTMQKPSWYLTTDFIPAFANEHVLNLTFPA